MKFAPSSFIPQNAPPTKPRDCIFIMAKTSLLGLCRLFYMECFQSCIINIHDVVLTFMILSYRTSRLALWPIKTKIFRHLVSLFLKFQSYECIRKSATTGLEVYWITWIFQGPFYWHGLTLIPVWINNYTLSKVWGENTYPLPNFNGATVQAGLEICK